MHIQTLLLSCKDLVQLQAWPHHEGGAHVANARHGLHGQLAEQRQHEVLQQAVLEHARGGRCLPRLQRPAPKPVRHRWPHLPHVMNLSEYSSGGLRAKVIRPSHGDKALRPGRTVIEGGLWDANKVHAYGDALHQLYCLVVVMPVPSSQILELNIAPHTQPEELRKQSTARLTSCLRFKGPKATGSLLTPLPL